MKSSVEWKKLWKEKKKENTSLEKHSSKTTSTRKRTKMN
jgi:hypothetical protein